MIFAQAVKAKVHQYVIDLGCEVVAGGVGAPEVPRGALPGCRPPQGTA